MIVDDEPDIREFLEFNFSKEGFEVMTAKNGKEAMDKAFRFLPQVILLDIMMPEMDGIKTCEQIRQNNDLDNPIIILLTARGEDYSQMAGYDAGSDDYVVKPVSPKVLIAKVKALLKRKHGSQLSPNGNSLTENLVINKEYYAVYKNKKEINLPRKEFEILSFMAAKPNRLFSREEIFNHIWGSDTFVGDRTMDVYIRNIRSKIGENYIRTVKGVGYKFVHPS